MHNNLTAYRRLCELSVEFVADSLLWKILIWWRWFELWRFRGSLWLCSKLCDCFVCLAWSPFACMSCPRLLLMVNKSWTLLGYCSIFGSSVSNNILHAFYVAKCYEILAPCRLSEICSLSFQKSSPRKRSINGAFEDGSDESETSSICSEKSFDYARRTSDVITTSWKLFPLYF